MFCGHGFPPTPHRYCPLSGARLTILESDRALWAAADTRPRRSDGVRPERECAPQGANIGGVTRRIAFGAIVTAIFAVLLTGCGGGSHTTDQQSPTTTRPHTTSSSRARRGDGATSSASIEPRQCRTSDLKARLGAPYQEAPGQDQVALVYTNVASTPCTMFGFPGFELVAGSSRTPATYSPPRQGIPSAAVVVAPGSDVHALFTYDTSPVVCGSDGTHWHPTRVGTIPPDETTMLTAKWTGDSLEVCSGTHVPADASIGPIEAGGAPLTASTAAIAAATAAAHAFYPPTSADPPAWESSGVVVQGASLWLALAAQSQNGTRLTSVTVFSWTGVQWMQQGALSLTDFPFLDGGDTGGSVAVASLTGSDEPDFLFYGNGADWAALSVISDAGGTWHSVPFDGQSDGVSAFGTITGNVVSGAEDLCGCANNAPSADEWFQYANGEFQPTQPLGPLPACQAQQLATVADTPTTTTTVSGLATPTTFAGPFTFTSAACDDGWALAKGTANGVAVFGLFNWQNSQWVSENVGNEADLASDSDTFNIPLDVLQRLGGEIDVTIPRSPPQ